MLNDSSMSDGDKIWLTVGILMSNGSWLFIGQIAKVYESQLGTNTVTKPTQ